MFYSSLEISYSAFSLVPPRQTLTILLAKSPSRAPYVVHFRDDVRLECPNEPGVRQKIARKRQKIARTRREWDM